MQITLSHKIRLAPTKSQETYFKQACGVARFVWNWALAEWKKQYESSLENALLKKPNGLQLKKQFNAIKAIAFPWVYEVTKYASQQPFLFLQSAFTKFFKKEARYPRFKKKGLHDSFYIGNDHIKLNANRIKIPKLGWVKMREALRFKGKVLSATVSRTADKWFVSLNVELDQLPELCKSQASIGIDLGIKQLATLYDGAQTEAIEGPKPLRKLLKKLQTAQKALSLKQKGSNNYRNQRLKVAKLHYRIRSIRSDFIHKLTTRLTNRYGIIGIEDLNVKGMMRNHNLARAIADMGFHELKRQLNYKSCLKGSRIEIVDRYYPSSKKCSSCGYVKDDLTLSDRIYFCEHCGLKLDRDANAARNIFHTVSSTGFQACGEKSAGSSQMV